MKRWILGAVGIGVLSQRRHCAGRSFPVAPDHDGRTSPATGAKHFLARLLLRPCLGDARCCGSAASGQGTNQLGLGRRQYTGNRHPASIPARISSRRHIRSASFPAHPSLAKRHHPIRLLLHSRTVVSRPPHSDRQAAAGSKASGGSLFPNRSSPAVRRVGPYEVLLLGLVNQGANLG